MIKRLICLFATAFILFSSIAAAEGEPSYVVYAMNSHLVSAGESVMDILPEPFVYKSVSYIPARYTIAVMGGEVSYNAEDNSISAVFGGNTYNRTLNDCMYKYDVAYLPARAVGEMMGWDIAWDNGILVVSTLKNASAIATRAEAFKTTLGYKGHFDVFEENEYQKTEKVINFSSPAGCYGDTVLLKLDTNLRNAVIRYTADGSEPTENSPIYEESGILIGDRTGAENVIANTRNVVSDNFKYPEGQVAKSTVIKARAFNDEGDSTKTYVNTYFVGIDLKSRYGVKVFSISTPYEALFDDENGIYTYKNSVQLSNKAECQAYLEIWNENNERVIAQPIGLRLNGATSRTLQQKSLRVYSRKNEIFINGDKKNIKYDLFEGKAVDVFGEPVQKFKRLILRNGGNDWTDYFMKDALVQAICRPFDVDRQASEDAVVFINGEFFGYYRLRERYDDEYFKYHYDLKDEKDAVMVQISHDPNAATLSEGTEADLEDFNSKIYYIINNDMSVSANYKTAETYFNTGSFIDYYIINTFFENVDWPNNNVKIWRNKNPENGDTRYKFMLSDEDTTLVDLGTIYTDAYGEESAIAKLWKVKKSTGTLGYKIDQVDCLLNKAFRSLLENDNFEMEFVRRYNDYLNTVLTTWNISRYANAYFYEPLHIRDEQRRRYPDSWKKSDIEDILQWAKRRPDKARAEMENYFKINKKVKVNFKSDLNEGYICANSIELKEGTAFELNSPEDYTASFYKDFPLWFKAVPNPGYYLDCIKVNGEPWYDGDEYVIKPLKKTTIEAVFKKI